jgi:hypothetical protein
LFCCWQSGMFCIHHHCYPSSQHCSCMEITNLKHLISHWSFENIISGVGDFASAVWAHTVILIPGSSVALGFWYCCKCHWTRWSLPSYSCNIVQAMFVKLFTCQGRTAMKLWTFGLAAGCCEGLGHSSSKGEWTLFRAGGILCTVLCSTHTWWHVCVQVTISSSSLKVAAAEQGKHVCQKVSSDTLQELNGLHSCPSSWGHTDTANHVSSPYWPLKQLVFYVLPWTLHFIPISHKLVSCVIPSGLLFSVFCLDVLISWKHTSLLIYSLVPNFVHAIIL